MNLPLVGQVSLSLVGRVPRPGAVSLFPVGSVHRRGGLIPCRPGPHTMKLFIVLIAAAALAWTGCATEQPAPTAPMQTPQTFEKTVTKKVRANYLLYLPRDYSAASKKSWPLMLFLHGAGERGTNLAKVTVHG